MAALLLSACTGSNRPPLLTPAARKDASPTPNAIQLQTQAASGFTPTPLPSPTPWPISTASATVPIPNLAAANINPLTGLTVKDPALLEQRPVLVKLANWPEQLRLVASLNQADLVFEYYIGHQMNHFLALFHGQEGTSIGPLAPARIMDARLTEHYQGVLAYASADTSVEKILTEVLPDRAFARGFAPCPAICTLTTADGENTFVDTGALREYMSNQELESFAPDLTGMIFDTQLTFWDEEADNLSLLYADFSVMDWRYDPSTRKYQLWQDHVADDGSIQLTQSFDVNDDAPIAFDNVLILFANYIEYSPTMYDVDFREGDPNQQALLLRDGKLIYGTWLASDTMSALEFNTLDGTPLALKPGRSWITFASVKTSTEQVSNGIWELNFSVK